MTKCLNYDDPILGEQRPIHVTEESARELAAQLLTVANSFNPVQETEDDKPKKKKG